MVFDKKLTKDLDKTIFAVTYAVCAIGLLVVYSATYARHLPLGDSFLVRQAQWLAIGTLALAVVINVSYQRFIDLSYAFYGLTVVLLVLVLILGKERLGAQRWFSIGNFAFQPSEFIKIGLILALANYIGSRKDAMRDVRSFIVPVLLLAAPFVLVVLQPDLGTALLLVPILLSMLLVGGAQVKYLIGMIVLGVVSMPFFWHFLKDYQKQRLLVFINPNIDPLGAGYTIIQSKIAVGSGGLIGKGWLSGTQNQLNFLPERHTDFIFSVIGEEWGFLGAVALLLLYTLIVKRAYQAATLTNDMHGRLIAIGVFTMLSLQVIVNIAMTIGMMPVVGVPLPMVSYGGSSLIATLIAIGLVINVRMRRSTF